MPGVAAEEVSRQWPNVRTLAEAKRSKSLVSGGVAWCVGYTVVVFKVGVVPKSRFMDVRAMVEVDVVARAGRKGMAV